MRTVGRWAVSGEKSADHKITVECADACAVRSCSFCNRERKLVHVVRGDRQGSPVVRFCSECMRQLRCVMGWT